ncbi:hypothetical protein BD309DRAFT_955201 [Dichomitus squalens]|uniref:Uncharacterized protein n=1 Tax=Dichomitus squalens TaxID=114155 RepID=A0A4Q9Q213_9APHY|nr:hypothetical protein BD309DRAFT_955201 [Dichomitus squalens]TBU60614.1 hypothetical protein BD310DRAFT_922298 [Dichomitus squalens]
MNRNDEKFLHDVSKPERTMSYPSNLTNRRDIRTYIARETKRRLQIIDACREDILQLRKLHNNLASVNALPVEILSQVFVYLLSPPGAPIKQGHAKFLKVAHVCHRWRTIALENPMLWTSFPLHHAEMVEQCVNRSGQLPLTVSLTQGMSESIPQLVSPASYRVRSIWISTKSGSDVGRLLSCFGSAPLLEYLHVEASGNDPRASFDSPVRPSVPLLFNGHVPSLRYLVLRDLQLLFPPPNTLRHLELGAHLIDHHLPSVKEVLDILANCPELEALKLSGLCQDWEFVDQRNVARRKVELSQLRWLTLGLDSAADNAEILLQLSVPEQARIRIATTLGDEENFSDIIHAYSPDSPHALRCVDKVRAVQLYWHDSRLWLRAPRGGVRKTLLDYYGDVALEVKASGDWGDSPYAVGGFLDGRWPFDASHVEALAIVFSGISKEGDDEEGPRELMRLQQWTTVLGTLPALKTVSLISLHPLELDPLVDLWAGIDGEVYCSKLESLEFRELEMSERTMEGVYDIAVKRPAGRPDGGFRAMCFLDCGTPPQAQYEGDEWAVKLAELGVKVVIDGKVVEAGSRSADPAQRSSLHPRSISSRTSA